MIFSCTKKVIDKIKKYRTIESNKLEPSFYNWYVDLMILERKTYFLFTHSETLFSFFIYVGTKNEINQLETLFENALKELIIREIGTSETFPKELLAENTFYQFFTTNSRKVLGSMNDFKFQIKVQIDHKGALESTHDLINHLINDVYMGGLKYKKPRVAMKEAIFGRLENKS